MKTGFLKVVVIILVAILAVAAFYFVSIKNKPKANNSVSPAPTANTPSPSPIVATQTTHNIAIQSFAFKDQSINIKKGDTIVWTNKDSAPHTVTGDNGGLTSSTINKNGIYSFTFNTSGTFSYHCAFHPLMKGTVIVE